MEEMRLSRSKRLNIELNIDDNDERPEMSDEF